MHIVRGVILVIVSLYLVLMPRNSAAGVNLVVDLTTDTNAMTCDFQPANCTLRGAINKSNSTPGTIETIVFDLGPGFPEIDLDDALPAITSPVSIQGGAGGATKTVIDGFIAPSGSDGFVLLDHQGSSISDMVITGLEDDGIEVSGGGGHGLTDNFIGVDETGNAQAANSGHGINIINSNGNTVSDSTISGNLKQGISISGSNNQISGNRIGTNSSGSAAVPNSNNGILIVAGQNNWIGGDDPEAPNLLSGNGLSGVAVVGGGGHRVTTSIIGANATATAAIPNASTGVYVDSAASGPVTIGQPANGNLIAGNTSRGIQIAPGATGVTVSNNFIGFGPRGALPNGFAGVDIGGHGNTIGGPTFSHRNIISGQTNGFGIYLHGAGARDNLVTFNYIGLDFEGLNAIPNRTGVLIDEAADNQIGQPGQGNWLSGNEFYGVSLIGAGATGNVIQSNQIGLAGDGFLPLGNGVAGIGFGESEAMGQGFAANDNLVGGPGAGNVIGHNGEGISLWEGLRNTFSQNSVLTNTDGGIELWPNNRTANDDKDPDAGSNNLQNYPDLTFAGAGSTHVAGSLNSNPNTDVTLEFFYSIDCEIGALPGIGEVFIGSTEVSTNADGDADFNATFTPTAPVGSFITATATHEDGSTSEFSECIAVVFTPPTPTPVATATPTPSVTPMPTITPPGTTPTPTPAATPPSEELAQGDNDCDADTDAVDALKGLQHVAAIPFGQQPGCPDIGGPLVLAAAPASQPPDLFGDTDCDGDVDAVDSLKILQYIAAIPFTQTEPCTDLGQPF